jgi:hypothetical protein
MVVDETNTSAAGIRQHRSLAVRQRHPQDVQHVEGRIGEASQVETGPGAKETF